MTTTTATDDEARLARIQEVAKANSCLMTKVMNGKVYGLVRFIYTTGLMVDVNEYGYAYRYCYESHADALSDFLTWDGRGDPPGNWIKRKGGGDGDFANPAYEATR